MWKGIISERSTARAASPLQTHQSCCPVATWWETATPSASSLKVRHFHTHSVCAAKHNSDTAAAPFIVTEKKTRRRKLKCDFFSGVTSGNVDSLVFDTLIPKPMLQRYISLLKEHRRVILSGPSGTGKTYLANQLSRHLLLLEGRPLTPHSIVTFNVDHKSSKVSSCI